MKSVAIIQTGERDFCLIGEWDSMDAIVAARPKMIATLDRAARCWRTSAGISA